MQIHQIFVRGANQSVLAQAFDGFVKSSTFLEESLANFWLGKDDDAQEFLAAGNERAAIVPAPDIGRPSGDGRRLLIGRVIFLMGEIFDHLHDDTLRTEELDRIPRHAVRQEDFGVQRFDDGQRLRHRFDKQVDGQVVDNDAERVAAQPVDEIGRFAVLFVLGQHQNFLHQSTTAKENKTKTIENVN